MRRPQKAFFQALLTAVFLWAHFLLRKYFVDAPETAVVCNPFGPFGIPFPKTIFLTGVAGTIIFFAVQWWKEWETTTGWMWLCLFVAGMANFSERLFYGCVADYIFLYPFPAFNFADVLLTIGGAGILSILFRKKG